MNDDLKILRTIADNPKLTEVLRGLLEKHFSVEDLGTNYPNEVLGQMTRARLEGLGKIDKVFREIATYKSVPASVPRENKAR